MYTCRILVVAVYPKTRFHVLCILQGPVKGVRRPLTTTDGTTRSSTDPDERAATSNRSWRHEGSRHVYDAGPASRITLSTQPALLPGYLVDAENLPVIRGQAGTITPVYLVHLLPAVVETCLQWGTNLPDWSSGHWTQECDKCGRLLQGPSWYRTDTTYVSFFIITTILKIPWSCW